jgi:hypothetical protein
LAFPVRGSLPAVRQACGKETKTEVIADDIYAVYIIKYFDSGPEY